MRITTLFLSAAILSSATAQTTLFSESFESTPAFTLNTTDAGSVVGTWNTWVVNNSYTGGSGGVVCLGFPFTYSIVNTPAQPAGITTPNGNYLHTASVEGINDGITNCSFGAADGLCITADNTFSRMTADVSTMGYADVSFNFWWLCQGGNSYYGEVYYSTNAGVNWTAVTGQYNLQGTWTQESITLPAFGNQATLRFGFRFVNSVGFGALDPGFGVDDVTIIGASAVPNDITTGVITGVAYCQGASLSVPYTAVGSYTAGNTFSAQLSDAAGSFATPTVIGTLSSTASGSIACTIPALTPVGVGYRVRVVSDMPVTVGTANAIDITVSEAPFAGNDDAVTLCKNSGIYDLLSFLPGASICGTWTNPSGATVTGQLNSNTDNAGVYTYSTNCPGGCPQDDATLTITLLNPANAGNNGAHAVCSTDTPTSLVSFVEGGDVTGIFYYQGQPTAGAFLGTPGVYPLEYVVYATTPCTNDTADIVITVNQAANAGGSASLTVCSNDAPVQLFTILTGTPQTGGTWTGPSGSPSTGVLDPATGASGLYTYTVAGIAPCTAAQGFVAVVIDPCSGIAEHTSNTPVVAWRGQQGTEQLFTISEGTVITIELFDAAGRSALRVAGPFTGTARVDAASLANGMYTALLQSATGKASVRFLHAAY